MRLGSAASWTEWVKRGWPLWVSVALALAGVGVLLIAPHAQSTVRRIGLGYEVLGVAAVLVELARSMTKHDMKWPHRRLLAYIRDAPPIRRTNTHIGIVSESVSLTGIASVHGSVDLGPQATVEERLAHAEANIKRMFGRVDNVERQVADEVRERKAADESERQARGATIASLRTSIKDLEVGNLNLSLFGLLWLIIGMVMTTGTEEVCMLLACIK